ncbi:LytR C-terminal domain-containing protein [Corynebacterium sp. L4756]|uniref:LytR C-terminal domain-containing protein n=1 Tax=unclassified Corynebacterium TaxID=2624378 RepID=UPI00374DD111
MTNETVDNSAQDTTDANNSAGGTTLPLRGFAMVLIAVAVMFGLWALYAFTQDDSTDTATEQTSEQTAQDGEQAQEPGTVGADTAQQSAEALAPEDGDDAGADGAEDAEGAVAERDGEDAAADDAEAAGRDSDAGEAAGAVPVPAPAPLKVNVLNNSVTQGLAADVSDRLRADGHELGEVGNFSDDVLPQTTVFFPAGNAEAEGVARELADEFNGVARENIDSLPDNTRDGVTLVLTEN